MARVTNFSSEELEDLFILLHRVLRDCRDPTKGKFAMVYVFAETSDNEDISLMQVARLVRENAVQSVGMCDGEIAHGYPGYDLWERKLLSYGIGSVPILRIKASDYVNTRSEAKALVRDRRGLNGDVALVAPTFHLVRVFMTAVAELQKYNPTLRVYPIAADGAWGERTRHSQGVVEETRADLVISELGRISRYCAPEFGGMPSARECLDYLAWRDA